MKVLWEEIDSKTSISAYYPEKNIHEGSYGSIMRAKVPGGWFVVWGAGPGGEHWGGPCFYPDPTHEWDGNSLP